MTATDDNLPAHAYGAGAYPRFMPVGDAALTVEFGNAISPAINAEVIALELALTASEIPGIVETAPSYRSLLVCYEPTEISFATLVEGLRALLGRKARPLRGPGRQWQVPVLYDGEEPTDLAAIADRLHRPVEEVIDLHSSADYVVFFMGFAPGLPNLGGLPAELNLPRRPQPRPRVPAGSVVMAAGQAGIISAPVPSGWHILGHTPVRPFDPAREEPFLFRPGDRVRFFPADRELFDRLTARRESGQPVIEPDPFPPDGPT
jgi:5-oxoprolinase (ATP-hydrolysing) subunit B